jgi:hypothetical protein
MGHVLRHNDPISCIRHQSLDPVVQYGILPHKVGTLQETWKDNSQKSPLAMKLMLTTAILVYLTGTLA